MNAKKYLIGLIVFLAVLLIGVIILFALVLNGTITRESLGSASDGTSTAAPVSITAAPETANTPAAENDKKIVVLDAGHGASSSSMSSDEKTADGWIYTENGWGEWRHFKSDTMWHDCEGSGCTMRGDCFYPIENGDRDTEPQINLSNAEYAKEYLEQLGYEVRMTRTSNDQDPSMSKRLTYCYKDCDTSSEPDADIFVCLHSNAGGGRGSAYMALSGTYDQAGVYPAEEYISRSNRLGELINSRITTETSLSAFAGGKYTGLPEAILFCKSPIPIAYMEIGFFDNASDLEILENESERIGQAVASGVNDYFNEYLGE